MYIKGNHDRSTCTYLDRRIDWNQVAIKRKDENRGQYDQKLVDGPNKVYEDDGNKCKHRAMREIKIKINKAENI